MKNKTKQFALVPISGTKNRVFIQIDNSTESTTEGGIILTQDKPKRNEGLVIAVSEIDDTGRTPNVEVGDYVFFPEFAATRMTYEMEEYLVVKESDIQAKLRK